MNLTPTDVFEEWIGLTCQLFMYQVLSVNNGIPQSKMRLADFNLCVTSQMICLNE